jgi:hypothetical protein
MLFLASDLENKCTSVSICSLSEYQEKSPWCETCHSLAGSCEQSNKKTSRCVRNGKYFGQVSDHQLHKNNFATKIIIIVIIEGTR